MTILIPLHKNEGILLLPLTDTVTFKSQMLHQRSDFIVDVQVCAMVTGDGDLKTRWNADKTVLENYTLTHEDWTPLNSP